MNATRSEPSQFPTAIGDCAELRLCVDLCCRSEGVSCRFDPGRKHERLPFDFRCDRMSVGNVNRNDSDF